MFQGQIVQFSENLDALREFVELVRPTVEDWRARRISNALDAIEPMFAALHL